jgi:hypothetical protein
MQQIADALDEVRSQVSERAGAEDAAPAEEMMEEPAVAASAETEEQPDDAPAEEETEEEAAPVEDEPAAEPEAEAAAEVEPTEADDTTPAEDPIEQEETVEVTSEDVPAENQPVAASAPNFTIRAGGDIPGVTAGSELASMDEIVDAMTRKVNTMRGVSGDGEYVVVASLIRDEGSLEESKMLRPGDAGGNSAKIRAFLASASEGDEAMTAAGWCAPKTPLYDIPGIGNTDTPVADSLPSFGVDRGGIVWTEPPSLGGISALLANLGRWTSDGAGSMAFDAGVIGEATPNTDKPCIDIPCGTERNAELEAIPLCMCFDNLTARAHPEIIKANTDLVLVGQARFKEQYTMAKMLSATGVAHAAGVGDPDTALGAARDFLVTARLVASQLRWRNRLSPDADVRLYAPAWLRDAIAADLAIQMPGDDTMSVGYSEIAGYLSDINLSPVWALDDVPVGVGTTATAAASTFDSYLGFAQSAEWMLALPGAFVRLDGGTLDLGVVRTKEDVQKNKYCEFAETFETVAYMGPNTAANAWAVRGVTTVAVRGGFAPAVASIGAGGIVGE